MRAPNGWRTYILKKSGWSTGLVRDGTRPHLHVSTGAGVVPRPPSALGLHACMHARALECAHLMQETCRSWPLLAM